MLWVGIINGKLVGPTIVCYGVKITFANYCALFKSVILQFCKISRVGIEFCKKSKIRTTLLFAKFYFLQPGLWTRNCMFLVVSGVAFLDMLESEVA